MDNATSLLDFPLRLFAEVSCLNNDWDFGKPALAEDLGVSEGEEIDNRSSARLLLLGQVLVTSLRGDERPELERIATLETQIEISVMKLRSYLVEVDSGLPELLVGLVEVPHTDLSEVTWMVLVDVRSVMVLTTGKTTTTGMLPVFADTTVTGRDVATTKVEG